MGVGRVAEKVIYSFRVTHLLTRRPIGLSNNPLADVSPCLRKQRIWNSNGVPKGVAKMDLTCVGPLNKGAGVVGYIDYTLQLGLGKSRHDSVVVEVVIVCLAVQHIHDVQSVSLIASIWIFWEIPFVDPQRSFLHCKTFWAFLGM